MLQQSSVSARLFTWKLDHDEALLHLLLLRERHGTLQKRDYQQRIQRVSNREQNSPVLFILVLSIIPVLSIIGISSVSGGGYCNVQTSITF